MKYNPKIPSLEPYTVSLCVGPPECAGTAQPRQISHATERSRGCGELSQSHNRALHGSGIGPVHCYFIGTSLTSLRAQRRAFTGI